MIRIPVSKDRNVFGSVTRIIAPPHVSPACLANIGRKWIGMKETPGSSRAVKASANGAAGSQGAPKYSKGRVVPRPSDRFVPSSRHMPGYTSAVATAGMLGDGETQGSPVAEKSTPRAQPDTGQTTR